MAPEWTVAIAELARARIQQGRWRAAAEMLDRVEPGWGGFVADVGEGRRGAARHRLEAWLSAKDPYVAPYWLAERCVWAGEVGAALDALRMAREDRQLQVMFAAVEPAFRPLHGIREFRRLVECIGCGTALGRAPAHPAVGMLSTSPG